ncbi:hypothetical protein Pfo_013045 [Paulownia fortunei]|nr:hypothetical protein Pfo_013045 [Paulownia fortunei]
MASCNGLSNLFRYFYLNTDTKSVKSEPFRVSHICGATTQKWSTAEGITTTSDPSTPHLYRLFTILFFFSPFPYVQDKLSMDYEQKIEDVRRLLQSKAENDPRESLVFVDDIQRVGVNSYFQVEIEIILRQHYMATSDRVYGLYTLHDVSLLFRLLRQHGYYISADVFNIFKGKDGRFQSKLSQDIRGLMELYEAAQLSFEGEYILDEAAKFSSQLLQEYCLADLGYNLSRMVANNLRHPYHKSIARLTGKSFLQDSGGMNEWEKTLRELAVMDLHKGQSVYQEELLQISRWWDELGLAKNLELARNQLLKWYTWSMAILIDDISMSEQRVELTKTIAFIYLIDDLFDLYGRLDELIIFTEAINKYEYYMKICYRALLDTTNEMGQKIYKMHGCEAIDSLKTTWASLCNAFLVEAKWFASGDLPTAEVYLENGKVSSGVHVVLVHLFFLMGLGGVNGGAIHLKDTSQLISSVATILRLWDDFGSAKDENQEGKDGSYIECYRKDHLGLSVEQAREHVIDTIEREWKSLNKECLCLNHVSASSFKRASLNCARMIPLMYSYDDNQQLPVLEEYVKFMLFNEIE